MSQKQGKVPEKQKTEQSDPIVTLSFLKRELKEMFDQQTDKLTQNLDDKLDAQLRAVKKEIGDLRKDTDENFAEVYENVDKIAQSQVAIRKSVLALSETTEEEIVGIKTEMKKLESKQLVTEGKMRQAERDIMMNQYFEMEFAVRIRNWKEDENEDLREVFVQAIEKRLGDYGRHLELKIEKIYRVNSWFARNRNVPRDVVIYFSSKALRNEVIKKTYEDKLKLKGQEVLVLKELPRKMLAMRKEYKFLTDELKKIDLQFKWDLPFGLSVTLNGKRRKMDTIQKAREFYEEMFLSGSPRRSPRREEERPKEEEKRELPQASTPVVLLEKEEVLQESLLEDVEYSLAFEKLTPEPKEKRVTRGDLKKKEEKQLQRQLEGQQKIYLEAVGGARSKRSIGETSGLVRELLQHRDDA